MAEKWDIQEVEVWDGNFASAQAMRQAQIDVVAAYPITPSTPIVEGYAKFLSDGYVDGEFIMVESEHAAMSGCIGAAAAGGRVATALEEAYYLSNIASDVYIVHRRNTFRAAPSTVDRVMRKENIHLVLDSVVDEVLGDAMGVTSVRVKNIKSGEMQILETPGLFVFVGHNVNNSVLKDENGEFICKMNEWGQVIVDLSMRTSVEGLYAAGDMRIEAPKQVVCAAGDGATAALQVISYIQEQA